MVLLLIVAPVKVNGEVTVGFVLFSFLQEKNILATKTKKHIFFIVINFIFLRLKSIKKLKSIVQEAAAFKREE